MSQSLYAFYGSLRTGMRLNIQFKSDLRYSYNVWLKGYDLYSLGDYPCAVKSPHSSHKILVEVTQVLDAETEKRIHDIEREAGYYVEEIKIGDDRVTIFLFKEAANNLRIDSGDWVTFFGQ